MKWIKCAEQMPELNQVVLALSENGFHQAVFIKDKDCHGDDIYEFKPFGNCCQCDCLSNDAVCWVPFNVEV